MNLPEPGGPCRVDGVSVDVERATIAIADAGFSAGIGLFETMAVREGRVLDRALHHERLERGALALGIGLPRSAVLWNTVEAVAADPGCSVCGWLKLVVTAGGRWIVYGGSMDPEEEGREASAVVLPWRRNPDDPLVGLKTLNYAANAMGLVEARRRGADEGLWLNVRGRLAEGCTSNLFVVRGSRIFTPSDREGILPGTVRVSVLRAARRLGFDVHVGRLRWKRLWAAQEAFLSSSLRGLRPLVRVEGRAVGEGRPGPTTRRIAEEVARIRGNTGHAVPPLDSGARSRDV